MVYKIHSASITYILVKYNEKRDNYPSDRHSTRWLDLQVAFTSTLRDKQAKRPRDPHKEEPCSQYDGRVLDVIK